MAIDYSNFIDLRIFDLEPGDIYRDSLELARLSLPQFELRTGTPEDAIFQAMAYVSAQNIAAINRLPNRLMSGLMAILGFSRQEGVAATVDVRFTLNTYDGGTIAAGTVVTHESFFEDELQEFAFQTLDAVEVAANEDPEEDPDYPSVTINCSCLTLGIIPPIAAGDELNIVSAGTSIYSAVVANPSNFANGINPDTDADFLSRSATYTRSLSSTLNKATQVDAYVATNFPSSIGRVKSCDLTNGNTTSGDISVKRTSKVVETFRSSATSLATIRTEAPHLFVVGDSIRLEGCGTFDGNHNIVATSASTVVFTSVGSNSASTSVLSASAFAGEDEPGFVTIFGYGFNTYLTQSEKQQIKADVQRNAVAGLTIDVLDPTLVNLTVTANVIISEDYESTILTNAINNVLVDYLSPGNYPANLDRVRPTQLISLIANVPGVVYVDSLSISPVGTGWLPQYGPDLLFRDKGTLPIIAYEDVILSITTFSY